MNLASACFASLSGIHAATEVEIIIIIFCGCNQVATPVEIGVNLCGPVSTLLNRLGRP